MRKTLYKKGDISGRKVIFYMVSGFILALTLAFFVSDEVKAKAHVAHTPESAAFFLEHYRFFSSPDCFAFKGTGFTDRYSIDLLKFTQDTFNDCYTKESIGQKDYRISVFFEETVKVESEHWDDNPKRSSTLYLPVYYDGQSTLTRALVEVEE